MLSSRQPPWRRNSSSLASGEAGTVQVADGEHQVPADRPEDHLGGDLPGSRALKD